MSKKEAREREFSEVEEVIADEIFREKMEERYRLWLDELKEESFIERK